MTDTPNKSWFKLITPDVLGRVGRVSAAVDPNAADESKGDSRNRFNPLGPTGTKDVYEQAKEQNGPLRSKA